MNRLPLVAVQSLCREPLEGLGCGYRWVRVIPSVDQASLLLSKGGVIVSAGFRKCNRTQSFGMSERERIIKRSCMQYFLISID